MKFSQIALQVLAAKEVGAILSNASFRKNYHLIEDFHELVEENPEIIEKAGFLERSFVGVGDDYGFICAYDDEFPVINTMAVNSIKPYLLFYRGDISLLKNLNNIVAVIGLTASTPEIEERESRFVGTLVDNGVVILSGLAEGCDTVSHKVCVSAKAPTIAVLPTALNKIFPYSNRGLAEDIVSTGGLLLTEYYNDAQTKTEHISRFIERDKLQALLSKAVVLTASFRKADGSCGSRHAMEAAVRLKINRYMMYSDTNDRGIIQFGLNQDYFDDPTSKITVISKNSLKELVELNNPLLNPPVEDYDQLSLI